jgi:hypothetical protein
MCVQLQGDRLYSELFNELYSFNLESRRWFPLGLRPPKKPKGDAAAIAEPAGDSSNHLPPGVSPEMHAMLQKMVADRGGVVHGAAAKIQANFRGFRVRQVGFIASKQSSFLMVAALKLLPTPNFPRPTRRTAWGAPLVNCCTAPPLTV